MASSVPLRRARLRLQSSPPLRGGSFSFGPPRSGGLLSRPPRSGGLLSLLPQLIEQRINLVGRHVHPGRVVEQTGRRTLTRADALGELHGDLAVGGGLARPDVQF